jgi:hypothetical protein
VEDTGTKEGREFGVGKGIDDEPPLLWWVLWVVLRALRFFPCVFVWVPLRVVLGNKRGKHILAP